ncbi:MAG: hypothetical protein J5645_04090 [Lachnospiraceae bacterium]|nr:hypothetical protein [Lachnospiraceae bacterium]
MRARKIIALILSLVMVFAMSAVALADVEMEDSGEVGAFAPDGSPESQEKTLVLLKEITAYNASETTVAAPNITYTYTIAPAEVADTATVTDSTGLYASVNPGVDGAEIAEDGVIAWTDEETLDAALDGAANYKNIVISFEDVDFGGAGIYRYEISETADDYADAGVTETDDEISAHVRFVDVYVRYAEEPDANDPASKWDIYGYTCFCVNSDDINEDNKNTTDVIKTTGFVARTAERRDTVSISADSYYTFNVIISKTVTGDSYSEKNSEFPFTVFLDNTNGPQGAYRVIAKVLSGDVTREWVTPVSGDQGGIVYLKNGASIKYIGIPCGVDVDVYETNMDKGVIYEATTASVATYEDETYANVDSHLTSTDEDPEVEQQEMMNKPSYQSRQITINTDLNTAVGKDLTIDVTNKVLTISPTGLIIRYAPYALVLFGGLLLLFFGLKLVRRNKDEEKA